MSLRCDWSWRTIERSIPSHFASRFQRLFDIGAATRARGARSVNKGQIWGEFEANFGANPALGGIPRPHRPPVHRSRRLTVWYHGERWGRAGPALIRSVEWCIRERRGGILLPTATVGSAAVSSAARGRLRQRSDGVGGGGGGEQRGGGSVGGSAVAAVGARRRRWQSGNGGGSAAEAMAARWLRRQSGEGSAQAVA